MENAGRNLLIILGILLILFIIIFGEDAIIPFAPLALVISIVFVVLKLQYDHEKKQEEEKATEQLRNQIQKQRIQKQKIEEENRRLQQEYKSYFEDLFENLERNSELIRVFDNFLNEIPLSIFVIKDCFCYFEAELTLRYPQGKLICWSTTQDVTTSLYSGYQIEIDRITQPFFCKLKSEIPIVL